MMTVQTLVFNPFEENTIIAFDETGDAVIVDPGCYAAEEKAALDAYIHDNNLVVRFLLNTHCHIDHVLGNDYVKEKYGVPLLIHPKEEVVLRAVKSYASNYGFPQYQEALPDRFIDENDTINFGNTSLKILFLPGHAPGHIGFYSADQKMIFSGDVLFNRSIGRSDLRGGDLNTLMNSIQLKLFTLPEDVVVFPGHGDTTTIGAEKKLNPYCALS